MVITIRDDDEHLLGSYRVAEVDNGDGHDEALSPCGPRGRWTLTRLITADTGERIVGAEVMLPRRGVVHDSLLDAIGFALKDADGGQLRPNGYGDG